MNKAKLQEFFIKARSKTYASGQGKVTPLLTGSYQYEYKEGKFLYRDIYNMGNGLFVGLETIYFEESPVLSVSYFGNFTKMSEEEVDKVLRKVLSEKADSVRLWNHVEWKSENFEYVCEGEVGSIDEFSGTEKLLKNGEQVYYFYYAGGFIG